jgi:hypothetical protein
MRNAAAGSSNAMNKTREKSAFNRWETDLSFILTR